VTGVSGSKATSGRFTPGSGAIPPYLAGRSREQGVLGEQLELVASGASPPADVLLIGPRGNGKTALLGWFRNKIFAVVRNELHGGRWQELERSDLLRAAETVAMAFERRGTPVLERRTLGAALSAAGIAREASRELEDAGYVWVSHDPANEAAWGTDNLWEPGIPSLMPYVLKHRDVGRA